ncbi:hypothetical protein LUZ63_009712 [Rhynchospora breviuscula]|uniref:Uncharacterized protein n=1 Tax=Rhynchospora breviuscula TaxID=2022672 RepID=A0A9Q0HNX9_9POAL|nr:hypothetical protein LUZ63_009712 [Rhynchospora breviuscula]
MACHNRHVSFPASSLPLVLKAEEELHKLKALVGSGSLTCEIILDAIKAVGYVYECIDDLLCMPSNQNGLSHMQQRRWVDLELEGSIKLLDMCSTSRDNLNDIKYHVRDLGSAIRRGLDTIKSRVLFYNQLVKKANKDVKKQVARKSEAMAGDVPAVGLLLSETRDITTSLLHCAFSILLKQAESEKTGMWPVVSGLLQKRRIVCKKEIQEDVLDVVEDLEIGLENLFRQLIRCRVSLLNICCL